MGLSAQASAQMLAQATGTETPSARATQLDPVIVQGSADRRAKPKNTARSSASRTAARTARTATRQGTVTPSNVPGARATESAWGPVQGYVATRSATGTKTDTPLIETPQSISVVTPEQMRDQGARTVGEALAYTAGVQTQPYGFDPRYDQFLIRGFAANQFGEYRDGLRQGNGSFAHFRNEPYGAERIEVMRGPSSVLYGANEAGGMVNFVSKMPLETRLNEAGLDIGNFNRYQGRFDFSGPTLDNDKLLYRFTGLVRDSGTQIPGTWDDRVFLAPSFTAKLGEDTTLTVLAEYERSKTSMWPYYLRNPATGVVTNIRLGDPSFDALTQSQASIGYRLEHRFNEAVTFRQNVRLGHLSFEGNMIDALSLSPDGRTLNRYASTYKESLNTFNIDNQVQARLATGPIKHTVLAGVDYFRQGTTFGYYAGAGPSLDLTNPVYSTSVPTLPLSIMSANSQTLGQLGLYAQDQMALGGWRLTIGGRQDFAELSNHDDLSGVTTTSDPSKFTGRAGLLYLFDNGLAPYVNYATSFLPQSGTTAPGRGATPFAPTTGESFEAGIKYQPLGWNSYFTATWFNLTKDNVLTTDPVFGSLYSVQTGQIRSRGTELEAVMALMPGLKGIASYSYTDATVTRSNGFDLGKVPIGVPTQQAAIFLDYTWQSGPLAGFGVGAGARWIGQTWADDINTLRNPAITAFDAGAHYDYRGMRLAVNARNLSDERVPICNGGTCTFTQGRTVLGSVTARW
jgi:iron complex outermembrane receptor protein